MPDVIQALKDRIHASKGLKREVAKSFHIDKGTSSHCDDLVPLS